MKSWKRELLFYPEWRELPRQVGLDAAFGQCPICETFGIDVIVNKDVGVVIYLNKICHIINCSFCNQKIRIYSSYGVKSGIGPFLYAEILE